MFTGLVEELGKVKTIARSAKSVRLTVAAAKVLEDIILGDSIAVNGTCLTVVEFSDTWFTADVMPETMDKTALAGLKPGDTVNLERALKVGDRLGGHIVSGHVDGIGTIVGKEKNDNAVIVRISTDAEIMRYVVKKGSIAIDGTSLTVVDTGPDWFTVSLIPHTASLTTVGLKRTGEPVNLEVDIIGKYVEKLLGLSETKTSKKHGVTLELLQQNGFTL